MRGAETTTGDVGRTATMAACEATSPATSVQCEQQKQSSTWGACAGGALGPHSPCRTVPSKVNGVAIIGELVPSFSSAQMVALLRSAAVQSRIANTTTRLRAQRLHQRIP